MGFASHPDMDIDTSRKLILAGDEDGVPTESLLGILIGSTQAHRIMSSFGSLGSVEEAAAEDLLALPGMGPRRVAMTRAALALSRRRGSEPPFRGRTIARSSDVYDLVHPITRHERREVMLVLALDARHRLLRSPYVVCAGSLTHAAVEAREALRPLIMAAASAAVLAHNHPSTCPEPSPEDVSLSQTMFEACALVGIRLLDHVVVGDGSYVSLADRGLL
jgi:DNA repair protein RadC